MSNPPKLESELGALPAVAHQLNNALLVIMGNLDLLCADLEDPEQLELLQDALAASQDAAELVERLRDFG